MTPEQNAEWVRRVKLSRFNSLFRAAFHSIAAENGWRYDVYLGTSSHGTIAIRSYLSALGV